MWLLSISSRPVRVENGEFDVGWMGRVGTYGGLGRLANGLVGRHVEALGKGDEPRMVG